jgi:hypothetical protein
MTKQKRGRPGRPLAKDQTLLYDKQLLLKISQIEKDSISRILEKTDLPEVSAGTISAAVRYAINYTAANVGGADPREYHG